MPAAGCRTVSRRLITDHCVPQPCFAAAVRLVERCRALAECKALAIITGSLFWLPAQQRSKIYAFRTV